VPIRSRSTRRQRPARGPLGWLLLWTFGASALLASLLGFFAIWSAATGYWGTEWPNVGHDLMVLTAAWFVTVGAVVLLLTDSRRPWPHGRANDFDRNTRVR
jgi:hypothetical protein